MQLTVECHICGKTFTSKLRGGKQPKYCSGKCRNKSRPSKRKGLVETITCLVCGKEHSYVKHGGRVHKYCSAACAKVAYAAKKKSKLVGAAMSAQCPTCGKDFSYVHKGRRKRRYCSKECANRKNSKHKIGEVVDGGTCRGCGKEFQFEWRGRPRAYCDGCRDEKSAHKAARAKANKEMMDGIAKAQAARKSPVVSKADLCHAVERRFEDLANRILSGEAEMV